MILSILTCIRSFIKYLLTGIPMGAVDFVRAGWDIMPLTKVWALLLGRYIENSCSYYVGSCLINSMVQSKHHQGAGSDWCVLKFNIIKPTRLLTETTDWVTMSSRSSQRASPILQLAQGINSFPVARPFHDHTWAKNGWMQMSFLFRVAGESEI